MAKYVCSVCGFTYDENVGNAELGIAPGTKFEDLPDDFACPLCKAPKSAFVLKEEKETATEKENVNEEVEEIEEIEEDDELKELSFAQMSALCSNLSKGCEKQYLEEETAIFKKLSEYYKKKAGTIPNSSFEEIENLVNDDINKYEDVKSVAEKYKDRGALRALVWSEKVSRMISSILKQYREKGESFLEEKNVYVCEICGFIYIGNEPPAICPVCKVPNIKLTKIGGAN